MSIGCSHKLDEDTPQLVYQKHVSRRVGELGAPLRDPFLDPDAALERPELVKYGEGFCREDLTHEDLNTIGAYDCPDWTLVLMVRRKDRQQVYRHFEDLDYIYKVQKLEPGVQQLLIMALVYSLLQALVRIPRGRERKRG